MGFEVENLSRRDIRRQERAEKKALKAQEEAREKAEKAQRQADAEKLVMGLAGSSDAIKSRKVKNDVKDDLKELYENGEIDKDLYKEAKKYCNEHKFLGIRFGKKKDSSAVFSAQANENHLEKVRTEGPEFSKRMQKKLDEAHITVADIYAIGDRHVGSDYEFNYSNTKKQPGEIDAARGDFNTNTGNVEFSKKDVRKIMKQAGYEVEKPINWGHVTRDALTGGVASAPLGLISATQKVNVLKNGVEVAVNQTLKTPFLGAIGIPVGAAISIGTQYRRVEDEVMKTDLPEGYSNIEDFKKYAEGNCTEKGAVIMGKIADMFTDKDGKIDKEAYEKAVKEAAGGNDHLNYNEAVALYSNLVNNKPEPQQEEPEPAPQPVKETCEITTGSYEKEVETVAPTDCYTVKAGDNWFAVAKAKYNATDAEASKIARQLKDEYFEANKEELIKKGIKNSRGAFFPKVGEELCLPSTLTLGDKEFKYNQDAKVKSGKVSKDYKGATINGSGNIFTQWENKTIFTAETCDGSKMEDETKEGLNSQIDAYKKANPDKDVIVK